MSNNSSMDPVLGQVALNERAIRFHLQTFVASTLVVVQHNPGTPFSATCDVVTDYSDVQSHKRSCRRCLTIRFEDKRSCRFSIANPAFCFFGSRQDWVYHSAADLREYTLACVYNHMEVYMQLSEPVKGCC
jgi:hypothetical protein